MVADIERPPLFKISGYAPVGGNKNLCKAVKLLFPEKNNVEILAGYICGFFNKYIHSCKFQSIKTSQNISVV